LCDTHYHYAYRHGGWPEPQQNAASSNGGYDLRFCGLFLDELELRGSPRYPQSPWFTALARADDEWRRLGPLKPVMRVTQSPETSGAPEPLVPPDYEEDLSRSVNRACTKWLEQHE
jgi:hypothetical protein